MISKTFTKYKKAESYVKESGFDFWKGIPIDMGDGYRHIFVFEYKHKTNDTICRMADLRWACRRAREARIPDLVGFIQVSIRGANEKTTL